MARGVFVHIAVLVAAASMTTLSRATDAVFENESCLVMLQLSADYYSQVHGVPESAAANASALAAGVAGESIERLHHSDGVDSLELKNFHSVLLGPELRKVAEPLSVPRQPRARLGRSKGMQAGDLSFFKGTQDSVTANASTLRIPSRGKDMSPRVLVMGGCSGSSFIMLTAMKLLEVHGVPIVWFGDSEMLKPQKNEFYIAEEGMGVAMEKANANATLRGGVMTFQVMTNMLTANTSEEADAGIAWDDVAGHIKRMGTHVVYARRENTLDHAVCKIRDCFTTSFGIPVNGSGERSDKCFDRRKEESVEDYKAKMVPAKLMTFIKKTEEDIELEQQVLQQTFPQFRTVTMEDLLAYQYSSGGLSISVPAWKDFMISWGVDPDIPAIRKYLSENALSHAPPGPHSDTIYNIDEVVEALHEEHLDKYLRT